MNKKQAIIIVTSPATKPFLDDLLNDIGSYSKYPIIVHMNEAEANEYEIGGIRRALAFGFDEFFILHDTTRIKDTKLFDIAFSDNKGKSVSISPNFLAYLGKYRAKVLKKMDLPTVKNKQEAVDAESKFLREYIKIEGSNYKCLYPDFDKNFKFEYKHGRKNMVLESDTLIKYKGTWDPSMIKEEKREKRNGRVD